MTTPGFTAEASIYRTNAKYFTAGAFEKASGNVLPAQLAHFGLADWAVDLNRLCPDCSQAFWFCPPPLPPWLPRGRCFRVCPLVPCSSL